MFKRFKNQRGFTLIEMLIVLMIISVLIILIVPNLKSKTESVNTKGCEALVAVVQAQSDAYYIDNHQYPASIDILVTNKYLTDEQKACPDGTVINVDAATGIVSKASGQ